MLHLTALTNVGFEDSTNLDIEVLILVYTEPSRPSFAGALFLRKIAFL